MDTEFINVYLQKQKAVIDDFMTKNLLLDTKVTLSEKVVSDLSAKVQELEALVETQRKQLEAKRVKQPVSTE